MAKRTQPAIEYRFTRKAAPNVDDTGKLTGRAAPFNSPTMIGAPPWGFRESINPSAFSKSIKDGDVVLLDNHDSAKPLSRMSAGTLTLKESRQGLDWDATPANTTYANDAVENVRAGNYGGCSFGFEVIRDKWSYNEDDDLDERELLEVKLHEISVCTFPAYGDTSVGTRDMVNAALEARERFYELEMRAKYTAQQLKDMLAKGQAFANANGDPSFPIADAEDLGNAIRAVGRAGGDHDAVRKYIIGRAKALGLSSQIPDNWNADGSISDTKSEDEAVTPEDAGHLYLRATDVEELASQIKAAKTQADRLAAMKTAKAMNCSKMIPDSWNPDGTMTETNAAPADVIDTAVLTQVSDERTDEDRRNSFRKMRLLVAGK